MPNRIIVDDRFRRYSRDVAQALEKSLLEAAVATQDAARGASSPSDYNISGIQAKTQAENHTYRDRRGRLSIDIANPDFRAIFFEKGTYQQRKGKLSRQTERRRESSAGQQRLENWGQNFGVKAQHFLRRGLTYGQKTLFDRIKANMP